MAKKTLAVTYRPQSFDDLTEQGAIKDILTNQIKNKEFQHAYLFTGPAGTGKTTSARIFANMINEGKGNPIEVDAASNSGVDNIRRIIDDSKKKALDAEYKIFIVDECHSLSSGAWQAMLKLLEEPPKFSIFILCTTDPQKIPGTILSRVQRYQFNKISTQGIAERLEHILNNEGYKAQRTISDKSYQADAVEYIAKISNGGMRDAITTMDKCLSLSTNLTIDNVLKAIGGEDYATFFNLLDRLIKKDNTCVETIDRIFKDGKDLKQFIKQFERFILDCIKFSIFGDIKYTSLPQTPEIEADLKELKGVKLDGILDLVNSINTLIKYESDPKTMIEVAIILYCEKGVKYE